MNDYNDDHLPELPPGIDIQDNDKWREGLGMGLTEKILLASFLSLILFLVCSLFFYLHIVLKIPLS